MIMMRVNMDLKWIVIILLSYITIVVVGLGYHIKLLCMQVAVSFYSEISLTFHIFLIFAFTYYQLLRNGTPVSGR